MKRALTGLAFGLLLAGAAHAGPQPVISWSVSEPQTEQPRRLNFRVVRDDIEATGPVHNSGMVAETEVAPNATLGLGLLRAAPKKLGSGDWRTENGASHSRKAAVRLQLKF
ncbi:MAG: hypothetical protein ACJ8D5_04275 [Sphingomicrobium sp.]